MGAAGGLVEHTDVHGLAVPLQLLAVHALLLQVRRHAGGEGRVGQERAVSVRLGTAGSAVQQTGGGHTAVEDVALVSAPESASRVHAAGVVRVPRVPLASLSWRRHGVGGGVQMVGVQLVVLPVHVVRGAAQVVLAAAGIAVVGAVVVVKLRVAERQARVP